MTLDSVASSAPHRRRWLVPAIAALGVLVLGIGGTLLVLRMLSPDTIAVRGEVHLVGDANVLGSAADCRGSGPYGDLREGAEVVITDATGTTVGVTALQRGTVENPGYGTPECTLTFSAAVPADREFYGVAIAGRDRVQFTKAQMGSIKLEIGR